MYRDPMIILNDEENATYICEDCECIYERPMAKCPACSGGRVVKIEIIPKQFDDDFGLLDGDTVEDIPEFKPLCASKVFEEAEAGGGNEPEKAEDFFYKTGIDEFDGLFGDGITGGTLGLFFGKPGTGKTAFLLKIAGEYSKKGASTLFISSEEPIKQITRKLLRYSINSSRMYVAAISDISQAASEILKFGPQLVIIDSISGFLKREIDAAMSSQAQVHDCVTALARIARENEVSILASAQDLYSSSYHEFETISNYFDSILTFEPMAGNVKMLRLKKSRSTDVDKAGLFYYDENVIEGVSAERHGEEMVRMAGEDREEHHFTGSLKCLSMEGGRVIFNEMETLVGAYPAREPRWSIASGIRRDVFETVVSIIEKYLDIKLFDRNISFRLKHAGNITDPSIELSIAASIISSYYNIGVSSRLALSGRLLFSGIVAPAHDISKKLDCLTSCGFKTFISSNSSTGDLLKYNDGINFVNITNIKDLYTTLLNLDLKKTSS